MEVMQRKAVTSACMVLIGSLMLAAPAGASWTYLYSEVGDGNGLLDVSMASERVACAVGIHQPGGAGSNSEPLVLCTADGGMSWRAASVGAGLTMPTAVHMVDDQVGFLVTFEAANWQVSDKVYRTDDGGRHWTEQALPGPPQGTLTDVFFVDADHGWTGGDVGLFMTTDGGATWLAGGVPDLGPGRSVDGLFFLDTQHGFAVGGTPAEEPQDEWDDPVAACCGFILETTDGGVSWSFIDDGRAEHLRRIWFADAQHGWAVGGGDGAGLILHTADGGATWTPQAVPAGQYGAADYVSDVAFPDALTGFATGNIGEGTPMVLATGDGGQTWAVDATYASAFDGLEGFEAFAAWAPLLALSFPSDQLGMVCGKSAVLVGYTSGDFCADRDGDGYQDQACGGDDCDDQNASVSPGAEELCNGRDENCDGQADETIDFDRDPNNCGECGFNCQPAQVCWDGACVMECPGELLRCGQECVEPATDPDHCGGCDQACDFANAAGACQGGGCLMGACDEGFVDLDADEANGCEYACSPSADGVEVCNGEDDDCDGAADEDLDCGDQPDGGAPDGGTATDDEPDDKSGGCATGGAPVAGFGLLALLGLALLRQRLSGRRMHVEPKGRLSMIKSNTLVMALALALIGLALGGAGCKDSVHLGDVKPVLGLGQDWDSDGVVDPLPADPGEGDYLVDFGQVVVLQRASRVVVLSNEASAKDELTWTSIELVAGSSPDFFLDPPPVNDLQPGTTTYFTVHYIPDTDGTDAGAVVVKTNDPEHPELVVSLAGEGVSPDIQVCLVGPDGELCNDAVEPSNLSADFGMLDLGESIDTQVVVRNTGEFALTLSAGAGQAGVDFGPNTSDNEYTLTPGPFTGQLQPGESQTYTITYSPYDGGADEGRLEVHSNDPDEPLVVIDLLGNGLAPKICPEPPFIVDFGSIWMNTSAQESYTFTSCGNQTLTITDLNLDSGVHGFFSFTVDVSTPFDLAPGESFDVQMTYAPTELGAHAGELYIYSNDPNAGEGYITLLGQATDQPSCYLVVHPTTLAFGDVSTSGFSTRTVAMSNNGDADCNILEIQGPDGSADFSFPSAPFTGAIAPGEMRQFEVQYAPSDEGVDQGTVTIVHQMGENEQQEVVDLTGNGVQPPPCDLQADPALLNFGSVPVAGHAELTTTIHNFGGEDCYITEADLAAGSDTSFHPAALPFPRPELGPGESFDLVVSVEPEHGGLLSGQIVIKGSEGNPFWGTPMSTVSLSAGGESAQMCLHPESLDFADVAVGDHRDMSFDIQACGPGNLRIRQISFDGANPDFTFATVPGAPRTIPAGTSHTVTVRYSPSAPGADFGRVLISGNDDDDPTGVVELTGNYAGSCPAVFDCQPDALWFEQTELGRSRDQAFICTNHGTEALTVQDVDLGAGTSPEFHLGVDPMPQTINPGESLHVEVSYIPADVGPDNGSVVISSLFSSDGCDNFTLITIPLEAEGVTADLPPCIGPQDFQPELIFAWPGNQNITDPGWKQVFMTPVVINLTDDDGDGFINENDVPDIVFNSYDYFHTTNPVITPAKLRAISGDDGHEIWTIVDPNLRTNNESQIAAGDIDGDNLPEILASKYVVTDSGDITGQYVTGKILCFEHDGTLKWESEAWHAPEDDIEDGSAIGIADLDHDGHPEIFRGSSVFNHRGELLWEGEAGRGGAGHGVFSTAADLDMAGDMELLCGNTAYRSDGTIFWQAGKPDGMAAVADFNLDGYPEVLLSAVGFGGGVFLLDGRDGSVVSSLGDNEVNAILVPVIADIDNSGGPEIGMVGTCSDPQNPDDDTECFWGVDVNEANLSMSVLWKEYLNDTTLGGGNSAFDFEGDGTFEVVQNDETYVSVYRGLAHDRIYQAERSSITGWENPVIVDVNNDNHAEIIVIENGLGMGGLLVYGNAGPVKWVETKRVWNQYDYHITNIRENGTIPRFEVPNWTVYNNFLTNEPFCE